MTQAASLQQKSALNYSSATDNAKPSKFQLCCKLSLKQKSYVKVVTQLAVQILFIFAAILATASVLPAATYAIALPLAGLGAATLSAFFFQRESSGVHTSSQTLPPLLKPISQAKINLPAAVMPEDFPADAPRGIYRKGQNCWINSVMQWIGADPIVRNWLKTPIPTGVDPFVQYIQQYDLHPDLIAAFLEHLVENPGEPDPVAVKFANFIELYQRPANWSDSEWFQFMNFCGTYRTLLMILPSFSNFLIRYDEAQQQNLAIARNADSQTLRIALSRVSDTIARSEHVQLDAAEAQRLILDVLPNRYKAHIEEQTFFNTQNVPDMKDYPGGAGRVEAEFTSSFPLKIPEDDSHPDLGRMFNNFLRDELQIPKDEWYRAADVTGAERRYQPLRKVRTLVTAPAALRFQVNRTKNVPPPQSILTKIFPRWFPGMSWRTVKVTTPINAPQEIEVRPKNGAPKKYRLAAVDVHLGDTPNSGHYVTYRESGNTKYCCDDSRVTRVDQREWDLMVGEGYLYYYLPVD